MTNGATLFALLTSGLLGMTGQGLRVIVGMKKLSDIARQQGRKRGDLIDTSTLLVSLLIGFIAGVLGAISITSIGSATQLSNANMVSLVGAGYAGTDFIEGFMKKAVPDVNQASRLGATPAGGVNQPV